MSVEVRRVPPLDELWIGDEGLVLVEERAVRVAGIGPVILAAAEGWTSIEDLVDHLVSEYGAPPDADVHDLVRVAVDSLAESGLVETRA